MRRSENGGDGRSGRDRDDHNPWSNFPAHQEREGGKGHYAIESRVDGAAANRANEGCDENSDNRGVYSAQRSLNERFLAQFIPEGKNGDDEEHSR